jgi:leucyl-tRNA synthetase
MDKYDHKKIEKKWQDKWEEDKIYATKEDGEKAYVLDMFPYPSGEGLHVGHVENYAATDIYSRYLRMTGHDVLHPIGWDAFGLPAENYAIKTGVHPREITEKAINNFRRQIKNIGLSYNWERELGTHTPEYYKWTQWLFLKLYENGLAYKKKAKVNWCDSCKTVLANEQVVSGECERCGNAVVQKDLKQWFFKITDFAEDLVNDLDDVDWPESTVINQRNWVGKSKGAEIDFEVKGTQEKIKVFTTRPDTLFGATYMVLAPEHPLIETLKDTIENINEVLKYVDETAKRTDIERSAEGKEKTGIELKGVRAVNPANTSDIPVFIADYVLSHYGTGAIMAVPAHDERDYEFANKFNLPIVEVIAGGDISKEAYVGDGKLVNSSEFDGVDAEFAKEEITKKVAGELKTTYKLRDWLVSRQRYWGVPIPIVYDADGNAEPVPDEHLPWLLPTDVEFKPTGVSPLADSKELHSRVEKIFGAGYTPEVDTMDTFVCSSWYYFRFADNNNKDEFASKESIEKWLPVDMYMGGAEHTVLHLLYARFITKFLNKIGHVDFIEPFKALRHQGMILAGDGRKMSKSLGNVINPDDVVETVGADSLRMYEMFMGPIDQAKPWNTDNVAGVRRFLERGDCRQRLVARKIHQVLSHYFIRLLKKLEMILLI